MRIINIEDKEAGQRFDKLLSKYLNQAPKSFIYKMLRKKNILLNGKKADGSEKLVNGDEIRLFLAEETILKFSRVELIKTNGTLDILYEDSHILMVNKPSGILSQKAEKGDISMVERIISYLADKGEVTEESLRSFRPSVCNRLDRNTSGILTAGKSITGLKAMGQAFRDRSLEKYYLCLVKGELTKETLLEGFLYKDEKTNQVRISQKQLSEAYLPVKTRYIPLKSNNRVTLLKVELITGRSHQIRAHLAWEGHPILGDFKYGEEALNRDIRKRFQVKSQLLHSYELIMPRLEGELSYLSHKKFTAPLPKEFIHVMEGEGLVWQPGIPEA